MNPEFLLFRVLLLRCNCIDWVCNLTSIHMCYEYVMIRSITCLVVHTPVRKCRGKIRVISGTIPGNFREFSGKCPEHFRELSVIFQGNFREMSGKFPGTFRKIPGNFREISGKFPGNFRENSGKFPGNQALPLVKLIFSS